MVLGSGPLYIYHFSAPQLTQNTKEPYIQHMAFCIVFNLYEAIDTMHLT